MIALSQSDFYDQIAADFPAVWSHEHSWINVHDGLEVNARALAELLTSSIRGDRVLVAVHSNPGLGAELPIDQVVAFVSPHVLKAEIHVADPKFSSFVAILINGVATGWTEPA